MASELSWVCERCGRAWAPHFAGGIPRDAVPCTRECGGTMRKQVSRTLPSKEPEGEPGYGVWTALRDRSLAAGRTTYQPPWSERPWADCLTKQDRKYLRTNRIAPDA